MGDAVISSAIPPLKTLTLEQIGKGLDSGAFTVAELVQAHIDQINKFDKYLHSVLQINPNAADTAKALDAEIRTSGRRGALHGAPILIKDNIVSHEPIEGTAGSLALLGAKPVRESPVVSKLREAGAVILGSTNCSEWANFRSRPSDSGWSARGGQTYAAYYDKMDPSGSSSGSGVAVDMGFCVVAIGTETSGSIISPSHQNNIVGLKPTTGLVSRDAIVPISPAQDTAGPMARTIADAAAVLSVIAGKDENDRKTAEIPFSTIPDYYAASLVPLPPNLRLGIPRNALDQTNPFVLSEFEDRVVAPLRNQKGATIVDCEFPGVKLFRELSPESTSTYMAGEFHDALPAYLATLSTNPQRIESWDSLLEFIKNTPDEEYGEDEPSEGNNTPTISVPQRNSARLELSRDVTRESAEFLTAKANATYFAGRGGIQGALDGKKGPEGHEAVDALLVPTASSEANYFAACEGHPQINIPLGHQNEDVELKLNQTGRLVQVAPNIPFGVSIIGRRYDEEKLLPICAAIELLAHNRDYAEEKRLEHLRD